MAPWTKCDACCDFMCNYHNMHAWECECPGLEDWLEAGHDPYLSELTTELGKWIELHP